jgi:hypothetical protein
MTARLIRHLTVESCLRSYLDLEGPHNRARALKEFAHVGRDDDGHEYDVEEDDVAEVLESMGAWAWILHDGASRTIHWWAEEKTPLGELIKLFGHELGHAAGEELDDYEAEESRADEYGEVAAEAYRLAVKARRQLRK